VSFFPQLIAGPIVHHKEMLPQIHSLSTKTFDKNLFHMGMSLLIIGLGKKLIIADNLAPIVNQTFIVVENGEMVSAMTAWLGMLAYTLQVYFDFSAYSDMAIGLGLMFGLKLPINFNSPYKSTSIIEFWRRWHMTLSRFLRDYLYIPLGGSRHGNFRRFSALIITMLLCGLWHGAGINFIIWGGLNGVFLVINVIYRKSKYGSKNLIPVWVGLVVTLLCVMLARVFFRTESFSSATIYLSSLWNRDPTSFVLPLSLFSLLFIFTSLAVALFAPNSCEICNYQQSKSVDNPSSGTRYLKHVRGFSIALGIILAFSLMRIPQPSVFIYFNF
jgi:alginate O-acetyltransferase complex protein AlgI